MQDLQLSQKPLDEIGLYYGTDKASFHHNYLVFYDSVLRHLRSEPILFMELGVGPLRNMGKSLLSWKEYFPSGHIVGVDIKEQARTVADERITIEVGDLGRAPFLRTLAEKYQPDVILDDASHLWTHQIKGFRHLFGSLKPGGIYICEDLHTSFHSQGRYADNEIDAASWFCRLALAVVGGKRRHSSYDDKWPTPSDRRLINMCSTVLFSEKTVVVTKKREAATTGDAVRNANAVE